MSQKGSKHYRAKLTEEKVKQIRQGGASDNWFGRKFGVSKQCIRLVRLQLGWKHVR